MSRQRLSLLVDVVDKPPIQHFHLVNLRMVRIDTKDRRTEVLLVVGDGGRDAVACSHLVDILLELRIGRFHVPGLQTDVTTLLHTLVRLGRLTTKHDHRVREETLALLQVRIDESVTCPQQYDEHEDAPCHRKARQSGTQLIALRCLPYLLQ